MSSPTLTIHALRVADLAQSASHSFDIRLDIDAMRALAQDLELLDLRKTRLQGTLEPLGKQDWRLSAKLGATVVQPCVATLDPVTTRIDQDVERIFLKDFPEEFEPEQEMDEDDTQERLGKWIDPGAILAEALSLALPLYPRSDAVQEVALQVTEPGKDAMTDADAKPFAALAGLRDQLKNPTGG